MKIQAKDANVKSMNLIVPIDGMITIDAKGIAEVSAKCAVELVKNTNDWSYIGKDGETAEKEVVTDKVKEEPAVPEEKEEEPELNADTLATLTVKELREMCAEAQYPEDEYKKLNKTDLIEYILNHVG